MPAKKSQNENNKSQKNKKGGQASHTNQKSKKDVEKPIEYIEVDEFTLDDVPSSRS